MTEDGAGPPEFDAAADRAHDAIALADAWLFAPAVADLLALFDEELPRAGADAPRCADEVPLFNESLPPWAGRVLGDPRAELAGVPQKYLDIMRRALALERIAVRRFNFRAQGGGGYVERSQAAVTAFEPATAARIIELCEDRGLVETRPPRSARYGETLILGGGYRRPLMRAVHARELADEGVGLGRLSFLGSGRELIPKPAERPATEDYAPGARDEFDLLIGAACTAFPVHRGPIRFLCGCESADAVCPAWRSRIGSYDGAVPAGFTHERQTDLLDQDGVLAGSVLSASTGRPPHRPNTADTLDLWARTAHAGGRILVVTSQYFVPFQTFDCLRLLHLPHGVDSDVIGFDDQLADGATLPGYLLMETLSAIRSARRLLVDSVGVLAGGSVG